QAATVKKNSCPIAVGVRLPCPRAAHKVVITAAKIADIDNEPHNSTICARTDGAGKAVGMDCTGAGRFGGAIGGCNSAGLRITGCGSFAAASMTLAIS